MSWWFIFGNSVKYVYSEFKSVISLFKLSELFHFEQAAVVLQEVICVMCTLINTHITHPKEKCKNKKKEQWIFPNHSKVTFFYKLYRGATQTSEILVFPFDNISLFKVRQDDSSLHLPAHLIVFIVFA